MPRVVTEEVQFHGSDATGSEAVFSLDFQPTARDGVQRLATGGNDQTVRVWRWAPTAEGGGPSVTLLGEGKGHSGIVHVVRWSPEGEWLASGGADGQAIVWCRSAAKSLDADGAEGWSMRKAFPAISEVLDLCWSADGKTVFVATFQQLTLGFSVDTGKMTTRIDHHTMAVQGIAADPRGEMLATISMDRSFRVSSRRKTGDRKEYLPHHHFKGDKGDRKAEEEGEDKEKGGQPRLLSEAAYQHFFRRISWSPDGALIAVPSGQLASEQTPFCTLLMHRENPSTAAAVFRSTRETVAARFSPELEPADSCWDSTSTRHLLAVATATSVYVYDSKPGKLPVAAIEGCHWSALTDLAWTPDARCLAFASTDGTVSFAQFDPEHGDLAVRVAPRTPAPAEKAQQGALKAQASPQKRSAPGKEVRGGEKVRKRADVEKVAQSEAEPEKAAPSAAELEQATPSAAELEKTAQTAAEPEQAAPSAAEADKAPQSAAEPGQVAPSAAEPEKAAPTAAEPEKVEEEQKVRKKKRIPFEVISVPEPEPGR